MTVWVEQGKPDTVYTEVVVAPIDYTPILLVVYPSLDLFPANSLWPEQPIVWTRI